MFVLAVKEAKVYFTTRPVQEASTLKSAMYEKNWQLCGTIAFGRGVLKASCALTSTIVASNIKIEYASFYDRIGEDSSPDGGPTIHCPRCTRTVSNAHGVCSSCGEVAYQCRKCRHINYDRLDAFLCVECGYCAFGSFSFSFTAAVASNATAIMNDADSERCLRMILVTSRLEEGVRSVLRKMLRSLTRGKDSRKKSETANIDLWDCVIIQKAYAGDMMNEMSEDDEAVILSLGSAGSIIKLAAMRANDKQLDTDPYVSLSELLRPRSTDQRRTSSDLIIRHLGRDMHFEEEETELFGLLGDPSGILSIPGVEDTDPLGRLFASVRSHRERRVASENMETSSRRVGEGQTSQGRTTDNAKSEHRLAREQWAACERLFSLLREAEHERYLLQDRLEAWNCLNEGTLVVESIPSVNFDDLLLDPSHCAHCSGQVAQQILTLWLRLFQFDPTDVDVDPEFVQALLQQDDSSSRAMAECKRLCVVEIALRSPAGATLVMVHLQSRLSVYNDTHSAEILGKILASPECPPAFHMLAMQTLESSFNDSR
jgi:hypothetical protein